MSSETKLYRYVRSVELLREKVSAWDEFPFSIPAVRTLEEIDLTADVTFFVGENGSGKSTLLEAIAMLAGFGASGGTKYFPHEDAPHELHRAMRLVRGARREKDAFFLRAETYYNVGKFIDNVANADNYGGRAHEQSHGESFLAVMKHRFRGNGLYLLDEPEAALSPSRQLSFLTLLHDLVTRRKSQFILATHSPIIMAYPGAKILQFSVEGIRPISYRDTEHYRITRDFLAQPESFFKHLLTLNLDE
jgi:predicted ATPase